MFEGKITRMPYFLYTLGMGIALAVSQQFAYTAWQEPTGYFPAHILLYIVSVFFGASFVVKRLHDLGRPGTHYFLAYIPLYNIYLGFMLLFKEGNESA